MPIEAALSKVEKVDTTDGVSEKELKDLQDFDNVIKTLDFDNKDIQEALTKANTRMSTVLEGLKDVNTQGLSEEDKQSIANIQATLGKLYDFRLAEDKRSLGSTKQESGTDTDTEDVTEDNGKEKIDQTDETVDKTKEEISNVLESGESAMLVSLMENPSNTDNIHTVFHENEGAYNKLLEFVQESSANREENPEQHNKAMAVFNEYYTSMGGKVPSYDYLTVGDVKDKTGALKKAIIAVDKKNPTDPEPRTVTFGVENPNDPNHPQWLKDKLGKSTAAGNVDALKKEIKNLNPKNFAEGLKGLMEKLSYLGGLIASSLDEFGLFDLPDWVKDKAKSFKEEMIQSQIAPENKDKYTSLSASSGLKEYFLTTYKTKETRNAALASNDKDFTILKENYFISVKDSELKDDPKILNIYNKMASDNNFLDSEDMVLKTTKQERVSLYQKAQLALKAEADQQNVASKEKDYGGVSIVDGPVKLETVGDKAVFDSLKLNGMSGEVVVSKSPTHGVYLEVNGTPIFNHKGPGSLGRYFYTSPEGKILSFDVLSTHDGVVVQTPKPVPELDGSLETQNNDIKVVHFHAMLMSDKFNPSKIMLENQQPLTDTQKQLYADTLLSLQESNAGIINFDEIKEKYTSIDPQINTLEKKIRDLSAEDSPLVPVYLKLQKSINDFFGPKTEVTKKTEVKEDNGEGEG